MFNNIILRAELNNNERRAALSPRDCARLINNGYNILVESAKNRIFTDEEYIEYGCKLIPNNSWQNSDHNFTIIGLKQLDDDNYPIIHQHIYFAHCYRGQNGSEAILNRFKEGGGNILDLEYLCDNEGNRIISFSKFAGIAGSLVMLNHYLKLNLSLTEQASISTWMNHVRSQQIEASIMVTGALGKCGRGACSVFDELGIEYSTWTLEDEENKRPYSDFLNYNIIIHCALSNDIVTNPFLTEQQLTKKDNSIELICDVTCDTGSPKNLIPVYQNNTSFSSPVQRIAGGIDLIAIDHLPTLFARESSEEFSNQLTSLLLQPKNYCWSFSRNSFNRAIREV